MDRKHHIAAAMLIGTVAVLSLFRPAWARDIPRCWQADQPDKKIEVDGLFRVFITTSGLSAVDVAKIVEIVEKSLAPPAGVGSTPELDRIEIDASEDATKHWQPSSTFPTLSSLKDAIRKSLELVLRTPQVTVECFYQQSRTHPPIHHSPSL